MQREIVKLAKDYLKCPVTIICYRDSTIYK